MRFISDNLVELNQSETDAVHGAIHYGENGSSLPQDLTAGIKLAGILHRGKIHAAVLAGVVSETISAIVQEGERIINDGDIERGRALAQRNFEADPEAAIEKALGENDLNFVVATLAKARANGEGGMFVGISQESAEDMTDEALADWVKAMRVSLVSIGNEQARRGLPPDDISVQAAFAADANVSINSLKATARDFGIADAVLYNRPKRKTAARKRPTAKAKLGPSGRGAKAVLRSRK